MTADELSKQVLQRMNLLPGMKARRGEIQAAIDQTLALYRERDRKAIENKQSPYNFDGRGVQWLEREVRRLMAKKPEGS